MTESSSLLSASTFGTRSTLIRRLRDIHDAIAWRDFVALYRQWVQRIAERTGLRPHDAEDVAQEVMVRVSEKIHEFEPRPRAGSFRAWLRNLTRWRATDRQRERARNPVAAMTDLSDAEVEELAAQSVQSPEAIIAAEMEMAASEKLARMALRRLLNRRRHEPRHLQIYELYIIDGWTAEKISRFLKIHRPTIYLVKHRIGRAVRREMQVLQKQLLRRRVRL